MENNKKIKLIEKEEKKEEKKISPIFNLSNVAEKDKEATINYLSTILERMKTLPP
jgi:hypothetical protein